LRGGRSGLGNQVSRFHLAEGPGVFFDELVHDVAGAHFGGEDFPGVGLHLDVLALGGVLAEPVHGAFDVVAGALEAIRGLGVEGDVEVDAPFLAEFVGIRLGEVEGIGQVLEAAEGGGGTVIGDDLVEIDGLVEGTELGDHFGGGLQLEGRTEVELAEADAGPGDAGEGALGGLVLDGEVAGVVVEADEFEEVFVLGVAVVIEAEEFEDFAAGLKEAEGLGLEAEVEVVAGGGGEVLDVLAAKADVGEDGGTSAWWDPSTFDSKDVSARVLKLHGSIDWSEIAGDVLPRRIGKKLKLPIGSDQKVLIWPASTKYRETQRDPYAQLASLGRRILRPQHGTQTVLVVCGYSFSDSHINIELERALRESAGELTMIVFTFDDSPVGELKKWYLDKEISDQIRIYAKNGFFHGTTQVPSTTDLPWCKFENVTRLLGGER